MRLETDFAPAERVGQEEVGGVNEMYVELMNGCS